MKKLICIFFATLLIISSCDEEKFLKEVPLDFYSPENSFATPENFNTAVVKLYEQMRYIIIERHQLINWIESHTDVLHHSGPIYFSVQDYLNPTYSEARNLWTQLYGVISKANAILARIDNKDIQFSSEKQRNIYKAEASFMRGVAYRWLGIIYGGVPIVTEEITKPKRDFVRAQRSEVWQQSIADVLYASQNLPEITEIKEEGRVPKAAAYHQLAELYVITKEWDKAIAAATWVIDNPNYALMKNRFGAKKNEPGDVYWDLFRRGNQNRSSGNKEGIWVSQFEYLTPGGGISQMFNCNPLYWQLKDPNGVNLFIGPTAKYGGRSTASFISTQYLRNTIWASDFNNDIRNSNYNIIRDIKADNPKSKFYDQYIVASGALAKAPNLYDVNWSVIFVKNCQPNDYPPEAYDNLQTGLTNSLSNRLWTDSYIFRLAETYLLRAEAYVGKGNTASAAADINVIRQRANASPVDPSKVTLDYVLDERARELFIEEKRGLTLMRLGLYYTRTVKYGDYTTGIHEFHNLWPIPQSEIDANTEAELEQNPGYN